MRTDPLLKYRPTLIVFCQRQEGHFITVSLVELMEKKMVVGAVCLHTSLAVIITVNKAVGSRRRERRDKGEMNKGEEEKEKERKMSCQCLCNKATLYVIVSW